MPTERIAFPGHAGDDLAVRLDLPDGPVLATALFAHCFTCSKDIPAARLAAVGLVPGLGVMCRSLRQRRPRARQKGSCASPKRMRMGSCKT